MADIVLSVYRLPHSELFNVAMDGSGKGREGQGSICSFYLWSSYLCIIGSTGSKDCTSDSLAFPDAGLLSVAYKFAKLIVQTALYLPGTCL